MDNQPPLPSADRQIGYWAMVSAYPVLLTAARGCPTHPLDVFPRRFMITRVQLADHQEGYSWEENAARRVEPVPRISPDEGDAYDERPKLG